MAQVPDYVDLTIATKNGRIEGIRGESLPQGLLYIVGDLPLSTDCETSSTIPGVAMQAMSAAVEWARIAKERSARELGGGSIIVE